MKANHKYRATVYLGKETYERLEKDSQLIGVSIATLCKILITTGYQFSSMVEKGAKNERK